MLTHKTEQQCELRAYLNDAVSVAEVTLIRMRYNRKSFNNVSVGNEKTNNVVQDI